MWISALVTLLNLALAATIGARLLWRARRGGRGPELWLSGYFLLGAFFSSLVSITVYSSLGGGGLELDDATASRLLALFTFTSSVACLCVYAFTWRTFRADAAWPPALVGLAALTFAGSWLHQLTTGGFVVQVVPGPAYWIERTAYCVGFAWLTLESLRYFGRLRKRVRIGLADPLLTHRFWLWGIWAGATLALSLSDLCARIAYVWTTGETEVLLVDEALSIIYVTVAITALVGSLAAACLWLTFFPTRRYVGWVTAHYAAAAAESV